jgi:hypothetical protein
MYIIIAFFVSCYSYVMNIGSTGLLFPYTLGALAYIKHVIKPANYSLTGVSGGAWCSILYHLEPDIQDPELLWSILVGDDRKINLLSRRSMQEFQESVAIHCKKRYSNTNITNIPISIVTTKLDGLKLKRQIIDKFENVDDLINYSLCSSYIPFISGKGLYMKYKGDKLLDGEITRDKCLGNCINSRSWGRKYSLKQKILLDKTSTIQLFQYGWQDASQNAENYLRI